MNLAAKTNSDSLSILKPGTDRHAVNIHNATKRARVETGISGDQKPEPVYRLALRLTTAQRDAAILLWGSSYRPTAEKEVVAVLERFFIKYVSIGPEALKSVKREEDQRDNVQAYPRFQGSSCKNES